MYVIELYKVNVQVHCVRHTAVLRGTRVARRNRVGCVEGDDEEGNGNNIAVRYLRLIPGWLPVHHIIIIIIIKYYNNNNIMYIIYNISLYYIHR